MFKVEHLNNRSVGFVIIWKVCCALFGSRKLYIERFLLLCRLFGSFFYWMFHILYYEEPQVFLM